MDITELIKSYSDNQKKVFTAFVVQLPVVYSLGYLYFPKFIHIDLIDKFCLVATCSIITTTISYFVSVLFSMATKGKIEEFILPTSILNLAIPFVICFISSKFINYTPERLFRDFFSYFMGVFIVLGYFIIRNNFDNKKKDNGG